MLKYLIKTNRLKAQNNHKYFIKRAVIEKRARLDFIARENFNNYVPRTAEK